MKKLGQPKLDEVVDRVKLSCYRNCLNSIIPGIIFKLEWDVVLLLVTNVAHRPV